MSSAARLPVSGPVMARSALNGVLFNVVWFALVYTASAVWAPLLLMGYLVLHFRLMGRGMVEARFIMAVGLFGLMLDHLLFALGVFNVGGVSSAAPVWISCMWPAVASTFMHAFSGLRQRWVLAAILGATGGAFSYTAGTELTDVQFGSPVWGPVIMASIWAVLFPVLVAIAGKMNARQEEIHHAR